MHKGGKYRKLAFVIRKKILGLYSASGGEDRLVLLDNSERINGLTLYSPLKLLRTATLRTYLHAQIIPDCLNSQSMTTGIGLGMVVLHICLFAELFVQWSWFISFVYGQIPRSIQKRCWLSQME